MYGTGGALGNLGPVTGGFIVIKSMHIPFTLRVMFLGVLITS